MFDALACEAGSTAAEIAGDAQLRATFQHNFEDGMAELDRQDEQYRALDTGRSSRTLTLLSQMGRFFAQFAPQPNNAYAELVQWLRRSPSSLRAAFATLNYDLLLDEVLEAEGVAAKVIRPHGSISFLSPEGITIQGGAVRAAMASTFLQSNAVRLEKNRLKIAEWCRNSMIPPAMAYYAKGKPVAVCPPVIEQQQLIFRREVETADRIFVVGVRFWPEDQHIGARSSPQPAGLLTWD